MSGNAFDAVVLLAADGLVAVGRVLRGLRRPSGAEVRAQQVRDADRLSEREAVIDSWEPDELWAAEKLATAHRLSGRRTGLVSGAEKLATEPPRWSCAECGRRMNTNTAAASKTKRGLFCSARCASNDPESEVERLNRVAIDALNGARWCYAHKSLWRDCRERLDVCRLYEPGGVRSAAVSPPAADNTTDCGCGSGTNCPNPIERPDSVETDTVELNNSIVAVWDYHPPEFGDVKPYRCGGCSWTGPDRRAHTLHRLSLVADMKNATNRIQQKLGQTPGEQKK